MFQALSRCKNDAYNSMMAKSQLDAAHVVWRALPKTIRQSGRCIVFAGSTAGEIVTDDDVLMKENQLARRVEYFRRPRRSCPVPSWLLPDPPSWPDLVIVTARNVKLVLRADADLRACTMQVASPFWPLFHICFGTRLEMSPGASRGIRDAWSAHPRR